MGSESKDSYLLMTCWYMIAGADVQEISNYQFTWNSFNIEFKSKFRHTVKYIHCFQILNLSFWHQQIPKSLFLTKWLILNQNTCVCTYGGVSWGIIIFESKTEINYQRLWQEFTQVKNPTTTLNLCEWIELFGHNILLQQN